MTKTKFEWKKTGKKFLVVLGEVLVLGVLGYIVNNPKLVYLVPVLEAARNYFKHK